MLRAAAMGLLFLLLAGCASRAPPAQEAASALEPASPRAMDWSPGNWWAYRATIGNATHDVALVLHEETPTGYMLGSNLSIGFFGLPFHGNLTLDRNPRIGSDVWPLFQFPLADGKEWGYSLFGHSAVAQARRTELAVPGAGLVPGYELEARSLGQVFARYTYSDEVGWFTRLQVIEPSDGSTVLLAELVAYGHDWGQAYYVEETLLQLQIDLPALPGERVVDVPPGYVDVRVELSAQSAAGVVLATLRDAAGRRIADAQVLGSGFDVERAAARAEHGAEWTLAHRGAGTGRIHLEVTGLAATGPLAQGAQSTRPALPQEGHTTSTGNPVGAYAMGVPQAGQAVLPAR